MTLEKYGFQSGWITLPGIEMRTRLESGFYFKNYGVVPNLREKTIQIAQELNIGCDINLLREDSYETSAKHISLSKSGDIGSAIFFKDGLDVGTNTFNYGHESVHALINLGLNDRFVEFLREEGFMLNPFETYSNEEQIAHVGGVLSLHKAGILWLFSHPEVNQMKYALMASRK